MGLYDRSVKLELNQHHPNKYYRLFITDARGDRWVPLIDLTYEMIDDIFYQREGICIERKISTEQHILV